MTGRASFGGARLARWRRIDLRRLATGDLPLKSMAIGAAILLWFSAMRALPPPEVTQAFDGRVAVERPDVPAGYVLRGELGDVGVTLRAPEAVLGGIRQEHLRATLDLSAILPGPDLQQAPVSVTVADERVSVVTVEPATVSIRLERRVERLLPVQARFANSPPPGFQAGTPTFRPAEVEVAGAESLVSRVTSVFATVQFGDSALDLAQDVRPVAVDETGQPIEGVVIDPAGVQVSVPVVSSATTRTVPLAPQLRGEPATGYWIAAVTTDPLAVTVSGARAAVEGIERIETAAIDVSGVSGGRTFTVDLVMPEGVTPVGPSQATVRISVVALSGTRPFPLVAVRVNGLGPDLTAQVSPETVSVVLGGDIPLLAALAPGSVTASVDGGGRGAGTHTLTVAITAPPGTSVEDVRPVQVTVTIRSSQSGQ